MVDDEAFTGNSRIMSRGIGHTGGILPCRDAVFFPLFAVAFLHNKR